MNKLVVFGLFTLALASASVQADMGGLRPLGSDDKLSAGERGEEIFAGQQWAVYEISRQGVCAGYALANVDTKVYMRIEVRGAKTCHDDLGITLAATARTGEYLLKMGDTTQELVEQ